MVFSTLLESAGMKKYLLLRNNRVSGPFSYEELTEAGLCYNDLVWIENKSSYWEYAGKIPELLPLINRHFVLTKKLPSQNLNENGVPAEIHFSTENRNSPESGDKKDNDVKTGATKEKKQGSMAAIAAMIIGVMLTAPVVKNIADERASESHMLPAIDRQERTLPSADFQKAIVTEIVPVYTQPEENGSRDRKNKTHKKNHSTKCKLAAFEDINGLQLTVFNTSADWVDKALVSLDYLRPNGDILRSENLVFTSIKPRQAQTIDIPTAPRGVQLRYILLKEFTHRFKLTEKHI